MKRLWDIVRTHLAKWKKRIRGITEMRVDGFEVFDFFLMFAVFLYFCTTWFTGPFTLWLRHALPLGFWITLTGTIAAVTAWGFLEENYIARRLGSAATALFFWLLGVESVVTFPHWPIGFILCLISPIPAWLCSQFAVYRIQEANRQPVDVEVVYLDLPDAPVVKMPRRV